MKLINLLIILLALLFSHKVLADIYKSVDENGIIQFTNIPPDGERPSVAEPSKQEISENKEHSVAPEDVLREADSAFDSKDYAKVAYSAEDDRSFRRW